MREFNANPLEQPSRLRQVINQTSGAAARSIFESAARTISAPAPGGCGRPAGRRRGALPAGADLDARRVFSRNLCATAKRCGQQSISIWRVCKLAAAEAEARRCRRDSNTCRPRCVGAAFCCGAGARVCAPIIARQTRTYAHRAGRANRHLECRPGGRGRALVKRRVQMAAPPPPRGGGGGRPAGRPAERLAALEKLRLGRQTERNRRQQSGRKSRAGQTRRRRRRRQRRL